MWRRSGAGNITQITCYCRAKALVPIIFGINCHCADPNSIDMCLAMAF